MTPRVRVLLVDDAADNRRVYGDILEAAGYSVRRAESAAQALSSARQSPPDVVLSDVSMPDGDGLTLLVRLREDHRTAHVPVVLMSGVRKDADEQTEGLNQGADDYLTKPVPPGLLKAKIEAVLRRYAAPKELGKILRAHGLVLDVLARTVAVQGRTVALTRKEFDLLTAFLRRPGEALSSAYLLETVWDYDPAAYSDPHTIGAHVWTLRKKIGPKIAAKIVALPGLGYRFDP